MSLNTSGRRAFLGAALAMAASAETRPDDPAWNSNFKAFIKQLNRFLESWNDGIFDAKQWKRVREAWKDLDGKSGA